VKKNKNLLFVVCKVMKIKSLKKIKNLKGKKVFLRVDFNVPMENGKIKEDYKIKAGLKTIEFLLKKQATIIVATHLGSPDGKFDKKLSTKPLSLRLQKLLKRPVTFVSEYFSLKMDKLLKAAQPKDILFLENLRFNQGELKDDLKFAKQLAVLADIYINDAFAVSHRPQASVAKIKKYLPAYAGLLLEEEILALNKVIKPKKPLVTIMGGAKISTKAPIIKNLYPKSDYILLGGGLANNFLKFYKKEIGRSLYDEDSLKMINKIFIGSKNKKKIILPIDVIVETVTKKVMSKKIVDIKKTDTIFDIGPETITLYASYIKQAQTLVWNGPMGKFEDTRFKNGTLATARLIATRASGPAYGLVGGGETVEALKMSGMMEYVDFVSTAGGAMLAYLGKEKMPGLSGIIT